MACAGSRRRDNDGRNNEVLGDRPRKGTAIEELFDLLRRKRLDKMRDLDIQRGRHKGLQALLAAFNIFISHLKQKIASY